MPERRSIVVGTSGHIDHGKTSLVRALTGTDTDRWAEEKRRGITIDLGFASLEMEPDLRLAFVDVPGHERFVKNMLAGVGGIDLVVMVVAADESVMPQTREHFEICRLLGVRRGVVALTKSDLADEEILELVKLEVEEFLAGSFLENAPMIPVSSTTGAGLDSLREALAAAAGRTAPRPADGLLRLPVDRVFTMKGFGTVVTGTLASGAIRVDEEVEALPGGSRARVRNLQVHGRPVAAAYAGQRVAANLSGVPKSELARGMCVVEPDRFAVTQQFEASLELLPSAKPIKHAAPVHVHLGTAETVGRVFLLEAAGRTAAMAPGTSGYVRIRLANPAATVLGDRFILRKFSPLTTIAGGKVLHPQASRHRRKESWKPLLEGLAGGDAGTICKLLCDRSRYGLPASRLTALTGRRSTVWKDAARKTPSLRVLREAPLWIGTRTSVKVAKHRLTESLKRFHASNPLEPGASVQSLRSAEFGDAPAFFADLLLRELESEGEVVLDGELVRAAQHQIRFQADEAEARCRLVSEFREAGLHVPLLREFLPTLPIDAARARRILANLLREGVLVKVSHELIFHGEAIGSLKRQLTARRGQSIGVGEFKALAEVSRKYAIPLLEHFDRQKVTLRDGNARRIL